MENMPTTQAVLEVLRQDDYISLHVRRFGLTTDVTDQATICQPASADRLVTTGRQW